MKLTRIWALLILIIFLFGGYGIYLISNTPIENVSIEEPIITEIATPAETKENEALIFYSSACPHCENVKTFLKDNQDIKIETKLLKIDDPATDKNNIEVALNKIKECKLQDN